MGLLLDTHIWIWFRTGAGNLTKLEIDNILDSHNKNQLFISVISVWEVAMLQKHGRLSLHQSTDRWVASAIKGLRVLPLTADIAIESVSLPHLEHKDPADRFILATSRILKLNILTHDKILLNYISSGFCKGSLD